MSAISRGSIGPRAPRQQPLSRIYLYIHARGKKKRRGRVIQMMMHLSGSHSTTSRCDWPMDCSCSSRAMAVATPSVDESLCAHAAVARMTRAGDFRVQRTLSLGSARKSAQRAAAAVSLELSRGGVGTQDAILDRSRYARVACLPAHLFKLKVFGYWFSDGVCNCPLK